MKTFIHITLLQRAHTTLLLVDEVEFLPSKELICPPPRPKRDAPSDQVHEGDDDQEDQDAPTINPKIEQGDRQVQYPQIPVNTCFHLTPQRHQQDQSIMTNNDMLHLCVYFHCMRRPYFYRNIINCF